LIDAAVGNGLAETKSLGEHPYPKSGTRCYVVCYNSVGNSEVAADETTIEGVHHKFKDANLAFRLQPILGVECLPCHTFAPVALLYKRADEFL
jgi:hypothetical protein